MVLLPHNLHAQVGRLERDIPLRSLQVGSHRQGVYNSPAGTSYTAEKRTNNKKTKVMTSNKEKIESLNKAMNVLNELYYFTNDNETMLKQKMASAYDTLKYMKSLMTKKEQETNPFNEGDDYWTIENNKVVRSCWDDISEELFDENPNTKLFKSKEEAEKEQETNPIQAQMKFRMPNGTDKYVTKTFNDKKHMRAYIDKVCKQEDCDLDEVWH